MPDFKPLLGAPFKPYVKDQIATRREILMRPDGIDTATAVGNKGAWVRLISNVEFKNSENPKRQEWVLYGGVTSYFQNPSEQFQLELLSGQAGLGQLAPYYNAPPKGGIYDPKVHSDPYANASSYTYSPEYGYKPMPGIDSVTIETAGAKGSLRTANITVRVWDKNQLDIISSLYLRLGYTAFLDWGHVMYYDNSKNLVTGASVTPLDYFAIFDEDDLVRKVETKRQQTAGNYDALFGMITNYEWSQNSDGGYNINIRLTGKGSLVDSLKINHASPTGKPKIISTDVLQGKTQAALAPENEINTPTGCSRKEPGGIYLAAENVGLSPFQEKEVDLVKLGEYLGKYETIAAIYDKRVETLKTPVGFSSLKEYRLRQFDYSAKSPSNNTLQINSISKNTENSNTSTLSIVPGISSDYAQIEAKVLAKLSGIFNNVYTIRPDSIRLDKLADPYNKAILGGASYDALYGIESISGLKLEDGRQFESPFVKIIPFESFSQDQIPTYNATRVALLRPGVPADIRKLFIDSERSLKDKWSLSFPERQVYFGFKPDEFPSTLAEFFTKARKLNRDLEITLPFGDANKDAYRQEYLNLAETRGLLSENAKVRLVCLDTLSNTYESFYNLFGNGIITGIATTLKSLKGYYAIIVSPSTSTGLDLIFFTKEVKVLEVFDDNASSGKWKALHKKLSKPKLVPTLFKTLDDLYDKLLSRIKLQQSGSNIEQTLNTSIEEVIKDSLYVRNEVESGLNISVFKHPILTSGDFLEEVESLAKSNTSTSGGTAINSAVEVNIDLNQPPASFRFVKVITTSQPTDQGSSKITATESVKVYTSNIELFVVALQKALKDIPIEGTKGKYGTLAEVIGPEQAKEILGKGYLSDLYEGNLQWSSGSTSQERRAQKKLAGFAAGFMQSWDKSYEEVLIQSGSYGTVGVFDFKPWERPKDQTIVENNTKQTYMSLGLLLSYINHICSLYQSEESENKPPVDISTDPVMYVDFNPNTNTCFSTPVQFSIDPGVCLVPGWVTQESLVTQLEKAYDGKDVTSIISTTEAAPVAVTLPTAKSQQVDWITEVFNTSQFRYKLNKEDLGKTMNIMLNTSFVLNIMQQLGSNNPENNIFLRELLEQIMTQVNKSLGGVNSFRVSIENSVVRIIDDFISNDVKKFYKNPDRSKQDPFDFAILGSFGLSTVIKKFDLKTDITTAVHTMLAISAQAGSRNFGQRNMDSSTFGALNNLTYDVYAKQKNTAEISKSDTSNDGTQQAIAEYIRHVSFIYGTNQVINRVSAEGMKNLFINASNKYKATSEVTNDIIPLSVNLTIDGIGGIDIYSGFTCAPNLLPKQYLDESGYPKVGWIVFGLTDTIQGNQWDTSIRGSMFSLRTGSAFTLSDKVFQDSSPVQSTVTSTTEANCTTSYKELDLLAQISPNLISFKTVITYLKSKYSIEVARGVFAIMYQEARKTGDNFTSSGGFNYGGIQTDSGRWPNSNFAKQFCRRDSGGNYRMFAAWNRETDFLDFLAGVVVRKRLEVNQTPESWTIGYITRYWRNSPQYSQAEFNSKLAIFRSAMLKFNQYQ